MRACTNAPFRVRDVKRGRAIKKARVGRVAISNRRKKFVGNPRINDPKVRRIDNRILFSPSSDVFPVVSLE